MCGLAVGEAVGSVRARESTEVNVFGRGVLKVVGGRMWRRTCASGRKRAGGGWLLKIALL